jgi:hypothetical protein
MMARIFAATLISAVLFCSGCCCAPCGPKGRAGCCLFRCWPQPITWNGNCNECGPCPGESCGDYCGGGCGILGHGGLFPWLRGCWSCGRGCGEIYCDEWVSDPPDCCDPCDQCHGVFTGPHGFCCLGPCQRVLAALHGYRYCSPPNSGPWCPIFGNCGPCVPACGCGDAGCTGCGVPAHGADIYYSGAATPKSLTVPKGMTVPIPEPTSIMEENWDVPPAKSEPGKPIHNARQPQAGQSVSGRKPPPKARPISRPASQYSTVVGSGVRRANHEP